MTYSDENSLNKSKSNVNFKSIFSQTRRKLSFRRKKLPVEAGGKKQRRKFSPVKISRREGLTKFEYLGMKKIKECYWLAVNNILEGNDALEQRLVIDTSFAIPMMALTFTNHRAISNLV
ncbi:hypothetical protein EJD97_023861 [Solanum chilense]|uniref:Uncharacterized protein n=1 Tax=Solanum chilense TaxID=4083 RepID=A0A6N2ATP2_SOLCI|nr:hypothetical protein EJD97_023861 [Solanum chilense]